MIMQESIALQGIEYVIDTTGKRKSVVIDLECWGRQWEDFYKTLQAQGEQPLQTDENIEEETLLQQRRERALERLKSLQPAGIVFPTQPMRKAEMPTIEVEGKPLSQIIIEDRR